MIICITWLLLSFLVGYLGKNRSFEFSGTFSISLILSPLIGLILVLLTPAVNDKAALALASGERLLRKKKLDKAIRSFRSALKERPYSITAHYGLARAYSLKNMPEKALHHLNRACENGYFNLHRLQHSPDLQNLRSYEGFKSFEPNRFMLGYFLSNSKNQQLLNAS
jgi:tetratricopeptide (TPR) repeat protein